MTAALQLYCKGSRLVYDEVSCLITGDGESTEQHRCKRVAKYSLVL